MNGATRREALGAGLFTALAGVGAVSVAAPDVSPSPRRPRSDAALIALAKRFHTLEGEIDRSFGDDLRFDDPEELRRVEMRATLLGEQKALIERMNRLRISTIEAHAARARVLFVWHGGTDGRGAPVADYKTGLWPLIRDLAGAVDHG